LCVPISIAQAIQRGGYKVGVALKEIADELGTPLIRIFKEGTAWSAIEGALTRLGLQVSKVSGANYGTFQALKQLASTSDGPVLVRITSNLGGHAILVGKTSSGVKIIDRYGMFSTLEELARHYRCNGWVIDTKNPMFVIANAAVDESLIALARTSDVLAVLVRHSMAYFDMRRPREEIEKDFEQFVQRKRGTRKITLDEIHVKGGMTVEVRAGNPNASTLSGIAKAQYGDFNLWPLIYDLNKDTIGANPNVLTPGAKLLVLPMSAYTAQELAAARARAPTWKNYG